VIAGDAVRERVGTTGVFRDIAANGAGLLAGRIGREIKIVRFSGQREIEIDDTGLDDGALILGVDREDLVHARENEHQAASASERAARKAGARATTDDGDVVLRRQFDDLRNFPRRCREYDDIRTAFFDGAVVFVEENFLRLKKNGARAEKFFKIAKKASMHKERRGRRTSHYSEDSQGGATLSCKEGERVC
jgi:hypothetical protein